MRGLGAISLVATLEATAAALCTIEGSANYNREGECIQDPYFFCPDPLAFNYEEPSQATCAPQLQPQA